MKDYLEDNYTENYEDIIGDLLNSDDRFVDRFEILCYLPSYSYWTRTDIDGENILEKFDVFKVIDKKFNDNETYLSYSDHDNFRLSSKKTIMKHIKINKRVALNS